MKEFPLLGMLNIHENLLEALLELQAYADVQAVLAKYDGMSKLLASHFNVIAKYKKHYLQPIVSQTSVYQNQPRYATHQHC